jgi:ABC-type cobalamin/Fe3+-siderophores transport system ATPase subunit
VSFEPITRLDVARFGCIQQLSVELTPLHAFVGPNDSGKSTVLRALRTVAQFAGGVFQPSGASWAPFAPPTAAREASTSLSLEFRDRLSYRVSWTAGGPTSEVASLGGVAISESPKRSWSDDGVLHSSPSDENLRLLAARVGPARLLRLDPDEMRASSPPIHDGKPLVFENERGRGLPALLQAISSRDIDVFVALRDRVRALFPAIDTLQVPNLGDGKIGLHTRLRDGTIVDAGALSEGLLYFLAYAVLQHLAPSPLVLVEEPENGLHPSRIAEIVRVLREVAKTSQVILATHSPLVLNELEPNEVTVLTRDEHGTHATPMRNTGRFEERSKVYALGELWVSYANGEDEAPLIQGTARP